MTKDKTNYRSKFTLAKLLLAVAIIAGLVSLLLASVQAKTRVNNTEQSSNLQPCGTASSVLTTNLPHKKQILFVCTGNYYRSRFAEALFNQKAADAHLEWQAVSRGLKLEPSQHGISSLAQRELKKRGVSKELCRGEPKSLTKEDLEKSDYIVFMDEAEHRPIMKKQFPMFDDGRNHYWHIREAAEMSASKACQTMSSDMDELIRTLGH